MKQYLGITGFLKALLGKMMMMMMMMMMMTMMMMMMMMMMMVMMMMMMMVIKSDVKMGWWPFLSRQKFHSSQKDLPSSKVGVSETKEVL